MFDSKNLFAPKLLFPNEILKTPHTNYSFLKLEFLPLQPENNLESIHHQKEKEHKIHMQTFYMSQNHRLGVRCITSTYP